MATTGNCCSRRASELPQEEELNRWRSGETRRSVRASQAGHHKCPPSLCEPHLTWERLEESTGSSLQGCDFREMRASCHKPWLRLCCPSLVPTDPRAQAGTHLSACAGDGFGFWPLCRSCLGDEALPVAFLSREPLSGDRFARLAGGEVGLSLSAGSYLFLLPLSAALFKSVSLISL